MEKIFDKEKVSCRGALVAILAISVIGILVYLYRAIAGIDIATPMSYFPLLMYVLMYISIIRYTIDYFKKGIETSIQGMLMRYCALTAASVIIASGNVRNEILIADIIILFLVPLMRDGLKKYKLCMVVSIVVGIATLAVAYFKCVDAVFIASTGFGFLPAFAVVYDCLNVTIQWFLFVALYIIRGKQIKFEASRGLLPNPFEAGNMEEFMKAYAEIHQEPAPKKMPNIKQKVAEKKATNAQEEQVGAPEVESQENTIE